MLSRQSVSLYAGLVSSSSGIVIFFFQAEEGLRDLVRSRGLGDVYKRQPQRVRTLSLARPCLLTRRREFMNIVGTPLVLPRSCLLYTSDAADERSSVDLGGRRIIKKTHTTFSTEHLHRTYISNTTSRA